MSDYIKVSIPKMKQDGEKIKANVDKIPEFVQELDEVMKKLGSCWDGPAWITFQGQVESDILYMLNFYDWIRDYFGVLSDAEKLFGDNEKKTYDFVNDVKI